MNWEEATKHLEAKLDPKHVKPPKQFGPKGDYIEAWHAIAEANRIFGFGEWSYDVTRLDCVSDRTRKIGKDQKDGFGVSYLAVVTVTVGGVTRADTGSGHGYDLDCGLAHESASKEAVSDALKRALRTFGSPFGLALYDKTRAEVGVDTPKTDYSAVRDRLKEKIAKCADVAALQSLWGEDKAQFAILKDGDEPKYLEVRKAFADRGEELRQTHDGTLESAIGAGGRAYQ